MRIYIIKKVTFLTNLKKKNRLAPAYLLLMMLATGMFPISVDGPDWMHARTYENACKKHWWKGLLFVNNFFNGSEDVSKKKSTMR